MSAESPDTILCEGRDRWLGIRPLSTRASDAGLGPPLADEPPGIRGPGGLGPRRPFWDRRRVYRTPHRAFRRHRPIASQASSRIATPRVVPLTMRPRATSGAAVQTFVAAAANRRAASRSPAANAFRAAATSA